MNSHHLTWAGVVFWVALMSIAVQAHARYDPSWEWRTLRHAHFTIYYPAGHEAFAARVLALCDDVYRDVTGYLQVEPRHCPVVLHPGTDDFNGFFAPFPNRISLYETPSPTADALGPSSDPLKAVFVHEFVHFVHITARRGWYGDLTRIVGEGLAVSNALSPGWWIEGLTTNAETLFSDGGRGRSIPFRNRMMSLVGDGDLWNLSAAGVSSPYRPPGDRIYLGGYFMVDYLRRVYGEDAPARMIRHQAAHPIGGIRSAIRHVTGKSPAMFYRAFTSDLERQADAHQQGISLDLPSGEILWRSDSESLIAHAWTRDGRMLALRRGYEQRNALIIMDPRSGRVLEEIHTGRIHSRKDVRILPDGRLLLCEPVYHPLGGGDLDVADLVEFDPVSGKRERRTTGRHVFSADIGPDGRIAASCRNGPDMEFSIIEPDGSARVLVSRPDVRVDDPCWSPDGSVLAATVTTGRNIDMALIDPVTGRITPLFQSEGHVCLNPSFSDDGRWLLFVSDRSGVRNVFAWDRMDQRLFQLTSVMHGASKPKLSPDGTRVSFFSIRNGLNQLCIAPFEPETGTEIHIEAAQPFEPPDPPSAKMEGLDREVNGIPLREVYKPFIHMPFYQSDEDGGMAGVFLMGGDPPGLNAYQFTLLYGMESDRPGYDLLLTNRSFWPDLRFRIHDNAVHRNTIGIVRNTWLRERGVEVAADVGVLPCTTPRLMNVNLSMGMRFRHFRNLEENGSPKERFQSMAAFIEADVRQLPDYPARSVAPGWGRTLHVAREVSLAYSPGEIPGHNTLVIVRQYTPSPLKHHGFEWRIAHQRQTGLIQYDKQTSIPRGYEDDDAEGGFHLRRTLLFSGEYRFPLWYADQGVGTILCHMHLLKGSFFVDHGAGWSGDFYLNDWKTRARTSAGCTLSAELQVMALLPVDVGVTAGYNPREDESFGYFRIAFKL